jgi:serine/threonine-protein kinase
VYSLGTILYQMLTGRPPFQAASPVDTVLLLLEQDPLPPRLLNPRADRDLEMIALRCLQKLPSLRYATAAELAGDLMAYLAGEPISARSGRFSQVVARWFRETHHATVLENWGLLWMLHSAALLVICLLTNAMYLARHHWPWLSSPWPYLGLWTLGLGTWAAVFWMLRRRAGPVTFVERQIAHLWAGSIVAIAMLFWVEWLLRLDVLYLSPVLALINGSVFLAKAGILSGRFYFQAMMLYFTAPLMAVVPDYGISIFGAVSAAAFFFPGLKYFRVRTRTAAAKS